MRRTHRRRIDEYLQCYRHHHLHPSARWIIPVIDYMEDHMWTDTEKGGDIWNGRWTPDVLTSLLGEVTREPVDQRLFKRALQRIETLTRLLQRAQRAIYGVRYVEMTSREATARRDEATALRRRRTALPPRTLFAAWNIPYCRPDAPKRKLRAYPPPPAAPPALPQSLLLPLGAWKQHAKPRSSQTSLLHAHTQRRSRKKTSKREEHRTSKFKLKKLRNILRLCR